MKLQTLWHAGLAVVLVIFFTIFGLGCFSSGSGNKSAFSFGNKKTELPRIEVSAADFHVDSEKSNSDKTASNSTINNNNNQPSSLDDKNGKVSNGVGAGVDEHPGDIASGSTQTSPAINGGNSDGSGDLADVSGVDSDTKTAYSQTANTETFYSSMNLEVDKPGVVGGLIGQINGRPIYVEEFFRPIADYLANKGRQFSQQDFMMEAYQMINDHLIFLIQNELVIAEAESSLTEEQKVGIGYWLKNLRADVNRKSGGSRLQADNRIRAERSIGYDEFIEENRRRLLMEKEIREEISSRITVSWREVENYYRDHEKEFHPAASIQLRIIGIPASDTAKRDEIVNLLNQGIPFEVVASKHSKLYPSAGGLMPARELPDGLNGSSPSGAWPEVDEAVRTIGVNEYTGPISVGPNLFWVYVESYEDGSVKTLYDVQHEIENRIFEQRFTEEQTRYFAELMSRSSIDDLKPIVDKLVLIAVDRWSVVE